MTGSTKQKNSLPGDITLPDKDGNFFTVSGAEPTTAFGSLGLNIDLANISFYAFDVLVGVLGTGLWQQAKALQCTLG